MFKKGEMPKQEPSGFTPGVLPGGGKRKKATRKAGKRK